MQYIDRIVHTKLNIIIPDGHVFISEQHTFGLHIRNTNNLSLRYPFGKWILYVSDFTLRIQFLPPIGCHKPFGAFVFNCLSIHVLVRWIKILIFLCITVKTTSSLLQELPVLNMREIGAKNRLPNHELHRGRKKFPYGPLDNLLRATEFPDSSPCQHWFPFHLVW